MTNPKTTLNRDQAALEVMKAMLSNEGTVRTINQVSEELRISSAEAMSVNAIEHADALIERLAG